MSSSSPVSFAAAENTAPSTPISARLTSVPSTAVEVLAETPWVRYSTTNMISPAPTTATSSGLCPARIDGMHEQHQHHEAQHQRAQRREPLPAAEQQHGGREEDRQQHERPAALEVHDLVRLGGLRLAARIGQHHLVADLVARRTGALTLGIVTLCPFASPSDIFTVTAVHFSPHTSSCTPVTTALTGTWCRPISAPVRCSCPNG